MLKSFQHPIIKVTTIDSGYAFANFACEVPKQVRDDVLIYLCCREISAAYLVVCHCTSFQLASAES
jgi:hypothetical protein